jgi:hypothetical protein
MLAFAQEDYGAEPVALRPSESRFGVRTAVNYTDNVFRSSGNEKGATYGSVGLDVDYRREGPKLQLRSSGALDYVEYFSDDYSGTPIGTLTGAARWGQRGDLFQWIAEDTFGQLRTDPLVVATPDTIENVNTFTTGPMFDIGLSSSLTMTLFGYYSMTNFEKSALDSDRYTFGAGLTSDLSSSSSVSLNVVRQQMRFDDNVDSQDFDIDGAYIRYSSTGSRTVMSADVGYSRLSPDVGDATGGPLFRLNADRQITNSSSLYLTASQEYSSGADALRTSAGASGTGVGTGSIGPSVGTAEGIATADPFKGRNAEAGWRFARGRNSLSIAGLWRQERYETLTQFDRTSIGFEVGASRRLRPTVLARVSFKLESQELDTASGDSDEKLFTIVVSKMLGEHLDLGFSFDWFDRTSSVQETEFSENRVGLRLTYNVLGRR